MSHHWTRTPGGRSRARGLGLPLPGTPGPFNAITDVAGVAAGYATMIEGESVRTGVTAILPRGLAHANTPCLAGSAVLNGNGEMTGLAWIEEAGELQMPITITNTHSCGVARDATIKWTVAKGFGLGQDWGLPVAGETYDGELNDINGFQVTEAHVLAALDAAASGPLEMGNVGGGTGMITYDFKGGSASASRLVETAGETFTVGVFVQSNFGLRRDLTVLGVPVGQHLMEDRLRGKDMGSIIAVVATDAPLLPHDLKRLARRVPMGMARTGAFGSHSSGDIFLAFSTANKDALGGAAVRTLQSLAASAINPLFRAVAEATEEAVLDAMICGETMTGRDGNKAVALPHGPLLELMRQYGRLSG